MTDHFSSNVKLTILHVIGFENGGKIRSCYSLIALMHCGFSTMYVKNPNKRWVTVLGLSCFRPTSTNSVSLSKLKIEI